MVPPQVLIVPLFTEMLAFDLVDTYWALILPQVVAPAMVFILKRFFDAIPSELEDAARVDGAGRLRVFWRGAAVGPADARRGGDLRVHRRVEQLPVAVRGDQRPAPDDVPGGAGDREESLRRPVRPGHGAAVLAALPLVVVFLLFQRQIVKGVATSGFGGQ